MYDDMPPCSSVIHIISRQSLLFDIIPDPVQPSSLSSSSLPSPLYFHYYRPPSYVVLISSHARTTSTSFLGLSLRFPPLSLSPLFFHFLFCPASLYMIVLLKCPLNMSYVYYCFVKYSWIQFTSINSKLQCILPLNSIIFYLILFHFANPGHISDN